MFSQARRSSSEEESSDEESASTVSDSASKATGNESWYDVKSDVEQQDQRATKQLAQTKTAKENLSSDEEEDEDDPDASLIESVNDIYHNGSTKKDSGDDSITANDHRHDSIRDKQEQAKQTEWTNPYWGNQWKSLTTDKSIPDNQR